MMNDLEPYDPPALSAIGHDAAGVLPDARERTFVVHVLRTIAEVEAIAEVWERLLESSSCNRAFSSPAWYTSACQCYEGISPYVLLAERNGRPVAILPLVIDHDKRTARFATHLSDYNDIIAGPSERAACAVLLERAAEPNDAYDHTILNFLRSDSNCIAALRMLHDDERVDGWFNANNICPYIDLNRLGGDYLRARSRASRKDLFRRRRGAERAGATAVVLDPTTFAAGALPGLFLGLHQERFGDASPLTSGAHRRFIESVLPRLFAARRTVAIALELEGRAVAIDLLHAGSRSLCSWNGGFAASAAPLSPGTLVIDTGIREAIARGCDEYDMLRGTEPYKLGLCNARRTLAKVKF